MEFEKDNTPYYIVNPSKIATIKIGDKVYTHTAYIHNNKVHTTYFILNKDGEVQLLEKEKVFFKQAEKSKGYIVAKHPRFEVVSSTLYVKFGDKPAQLIKRRRDLAKLFPSHQEELSKFIKKNKISTKDPKDLSKVIDYYNNLAN
ncbi:hypothetical protein [Balneicella halophila]|uniref:hypothetical protein n=1 Tax=Balneicella halophila TaxID=1537566 RepID=UPI000E305BA5|nr:hypothetical protein [Balneicella halophila]